MKIFTIRYATTDRTGDMAGKMFVPFNSKPYYAKRHEANKAITVFLRSKRNKGLHGEDFWIVENELVETNIHPVR